MTRTDRFAHIGFETFRVSSILAFLITVPGYGQGYIGDAFVWLCGIIGMPAILVFSLFVLLTMAGAMYVLAYLMGPIVDAVTIMRDTLRRMRSTHS